MGFGAGCLLVRLGRRGENVIDVFDQRAHPRGVGAEIVAAIARGRAHIDAGALLRRAHAHDDIVAETEDRRARDRLDQTVARRRALRRPRIDHMPPALGDDLEHGVVSFLRRRGGEIGLDVGIGDALLLGGVAGRHR